MNRLNFRVSFFTRAVAFALLVLCAVAPTHALAQAQDSINITGIYKAQGVGGGWKFTVVNGNASHSPINNFRIYLTNAPDGSQLNQGDGPTAAWQGSVSNDGDTVDFQATGNSIVAGQSLSGFDFFGSFGTPDYPYTFTWETYSNSTLLSTGTFTLTYTQFQEFTTLDNATATTSTVGTDPVFNFTVNNKNDYYGQNSQITAVAFQLLDQSSGTIRPSYNRAPAGWGLDSVTPSTAYFSGREGNFIDAGASLAGFIVSLRANPAATKFNWVLRCYTGSAPAILIDRDTILNIAASGTAASTPSADTVFGEKVLGCLYKINVENFHSQNSKQNSRITSLVLSGATPGVTISSVTGYPANWNKSISANQDTVTFLAGVDSSGIPSGIIDSSISIAMNNPSDGAFGLNWQTKYKYAGQQLAPISSGTLQLSCAAGAAVNDSATSNPGSATCQYILAVKNTHNSPPSNVYGISLAITDGSGTFDVNSLSSSKLWDVSHTGTTAVRFSVPSTSLNSQTSGESQNVIFTVIPKTSGKPVNIVWQTYDQNQTPLEGPQSFAVTCSPIVQLKCDSVWYTSVSPTSCYQNFGFLDNNTKEITSITIAAQNGGWTIDSASAPIPWSKSVITPTSTSVTFTSSQGLPPGTPQDGFLVGFSSPSTRDTFTVSVTTQSNNSCDTVITLACLASSVQQLGLKASSIKLSAHPNPFQSATEITLSLPVRMSVSVSVIDLLGRTQKTLQRGELSEGSHNFKLDSTSLVAGTYYVRVETPIGISTRKIVLSK